MKRSQCHSTIRIPIPLDPISCGKFIPWFRPPPKPRERESVDVLCGMERGHAGKHKVTFKGIEYEWRFE